MTTKLQPPLAERLKKGAVILGELWKIPENRCPVGWSLEECDCQPKKKFCINRLHWIILAIEDARDLEEGPYGLALAMTASEWDSTKLLMKLNHPTIKDLAVGASKGSFMTMVDMAKLMEEPAALEGICIVMKTFENSKVQGFSSPVATPVAVLEDPTALLANPDEAFE